MSAILMITPRTVGRTLYTVVVFGESSIFVFLLTVGSGVCCRVKTQKQEEQEQEQQESSWHAAQRGDALEVDKSPPSVLYEDTASACLPGHCTQSFRLLGLATCFACIMKT